MSTRNPLHSAELRVTGAMALIFALRMFGLFLLLPVFSLLGDELRGASPALIGTAIGAYGMMQALLQIPFGLMSDRLGRRPMILAGLALFILGGVVAALSETIYGVIAGRMLQGSGAIASVIMAMVGDVVSDAHRTRAMALVGMSVGGSFVLALIFGPLMAQGLGLSGLFWTTSAMGAGALLVALWMVPATKPAQRQTAIHAPQGLRVLFRHKDLWRLNLGILMLHLVLTATFVALPLVLREQLEMPLGQHSLLYLGVMIAGVVGMVPLIIMAERRSVRPVKLAAITMLVLAEAGLVVAGSSFFYHVIALVLFFTAFNLLEALLPSLVGRAAPAGVRGAAMGLYSSSQFLGVFLGGQLGGLLLGTEGATAVFAGCALLLSGWGAAALSFRELPRLDSRVLPIPDQLGDGEAWLASLLAIEGVEEGMMVPEDGIAVLKVDPRKVDDGALEQWAGGRAQGG